MWSVSDICEEKKYFLSGFFLKSDLRLNVNQSLLSSWQVLTELLQKECANCNIMTTANWKEAEKEQMTGRYVFILTINQRQKNKLGRFKHDQIRVLSV